MNHTEEHPSCVDPLVDEVRNVRKAISQHIEQQHQERVVKSVRGLMEQMEGGRQGRGREEFDGQN